MTLTPALLARFDTSKKCGNSYISSEKDCNNGMVKKVAIGAAAVGGASALTAGALVGTRPGRRLVRKTKVKWAKAGMTPDQASQRRVNRTVRQATAKANRSPAAPSAPAAPKRPRVRKPTFNATKRSGGLRLGRRSAKGITTLTGRGLNWRRTTFRI